MSMDDKKPLVTVVTPSYNQAAFLARTMESVFSQDYPNIEYIVIDGGSTDGSVELLGKHADRLAYWISEPDQGQTSAINKGFARANGEILAWINSDDTYQPGAIAEVVAYLTAHPDVGMAYGDAHFIDEQDRVIGRFPAAQTDYQRLQQGYVHIPQQSAFWRTSVWEQVGPLDEQLYFAMDYYLWLRIAEHYPIRYVPGAFWANFRLHSDSKTIAEDDRCWPEMMDIHLRDGGSRFSLLGVKYAARKILAPLVTWRRRRRVQQAREVD